MNQKHSTCLNLCLLLTSLTCPAGAISAQEASAFTITIHVYNYAAVTEKTLARAKHEGGRIFGNAGLTALWVDHPVNDAGSRRPPQNSSDSWNDNHFVLRLLTRSRKGLAKYAMGEALSFRIANVSMDRVAQQLTVGELSAGQVLGHAIAHEIGHHLLGNNSHAPHGIMVAKWSKEQLRRISKGDLLFTQQEVKRIQEEVRHRSRSVVRVGRLSQREPIGFGRIAFGLPIPSLTNPTRTIRA